MSVRDPSDALLSPMRRIGDRAVDALVAERLSGHQDLGRLLGTLFRTARMPQDEPFVAAYERALPRIQLAHPEKIARGQQLFALFGPEVLLILGSYALPLAYAAGDGVQVIYRARRLKEDPVRRLCDTAQMVLDAMQPGGLAEGGIGWRAARKVRLIHALVRRHVTDASAAPWPPEWGTPINQEDQAGTLLSFSVAVLHGLRKMGARLAPEDADAYIFAWSAIGRLLGIDEALLPETEEEAACLARRIGERQIRATPEGKELAGQLLDAVGTLFPVRGYALSLTHFFLEDSPFGADVATALGLSPANWTRWLVRARAAQKRSVLALLDHVPGATRRRSYVARRFAQAMILLRRPDGNVPFEVPEDWMGRWGLSKSP